MRIEPISSRKVDAHPRGRVSPPDGKRRGHIFVTPTLSRRRPALRGGRKAALRDHSDSAARHAHNTIYLKNNEWHKDPGGYGGFSTSGTQRHYATHDDGASSWSWQQRWSIVVDATASGGWARPLVTGRVRLGLANGNRGAQVSSAEIQVHRTGAFMTRAGRRAGRGRTAGGTRADGGRDAGGRRAGRGRTAGGTRADGGRDTGGKKAGFPGALAPGNPASCA